MKEVKTFFIRTYGCQMNELDSEIVIGILTRKGFIQTSNEDLADIIIFNTCSVRDLAERKVMGKLGLLSRGKKKHAIIGVIGCMAMVKKDLFFKKFPHVDFVLGTNNLSEIGDIIEEIIFSPSQICRVDKTFEENIDYSIAKRKDPVKAYISIIRGCNKHCTYCIVPYTRGKEISRPFNSILEECRILADKGYREVILLGQNVNSYGKDKDWNYLFSDLLHDIDKIQGIDRIRFMTSHPIDITIDLMKAVRDLPSVCEFIHFPLQAGSSRILKKMHRIYTKEEYLEKIALFKELVPNVTFGTDIIVGFPTETENEFLETYELFKEIRYSVAFIFAYSPRPKAPSSRWHDDVPLHIKKQRLQKMLQLHDTIINEDNNKLIGNVEEVLVEKENKDHTAIQGRTRNWNKVIFPGKPSLIKTMQQVKLKEYNHQTFIGEIV